MPTILASSSYFGGVSMLINSHDANLMSTGQIHTLSNDRSPIPSHHAKKLLDLKFASCEQCLQQPVSRKRRPGFMLEIGNADHPNLSAPHPRRTRWRDTGLHLGRLKG